MFGPSSAGFSEPSIRTKEVVLKVLMVLMVPSAR
jgi:hypothetical protein